MGQMISISRPDGDTIPCYRANAVGVSSAPVIIVIQEWWGLNNQIKGTADRLAQDGFDAIVPDLYRGKITTDADEASHMSSQLDWGGAVADVAAIVKSGGDEVPTPFGITGFCMGGGITFLAASKVKGLAAACPFYGVPQEITGLANIKIPLQGHFATRDGWASRTAMAKIEKVLNDAEVVHEFFWYEADHAFMNEARPEVYHPTIAKLAWSRMIAFFRAHLD